MISQSHIQACLQQIERRLNWGPSDQWANQDFEFLVEEIFNKTGENLSLTTLKRIWGKVDYQSQPSISTLNVLAQYLGFKHWRDFQNGFNINKTPVKEIEDKSVKRLSWKFVLNHKVGLTLVILIAISSLFFFIDRRQVFYKAEEVTFESRKVSSGLPNTVVFNYDVSQVIADSFFIQQSWDARRRIRVSPQEFTHTSFYYFPGYFHAKLIANDHIMKEHEVFVESDGWIGMIERFPEPVYVNEYLLKDKFLTVNLDKIKQTSDIYQDKDFWIDYYYVNDMGEIDGNNFEYQCRIRNNSDLGSVCHESRISLICTYGRFNIPLSNPGCVSNLFLTLGNSYYSGKEHDLSPLGCDLNDWVDFKLKVEDKRCEISINDSTVMTESYSMDLGRIVGFKFKFNGIGEVDNVKLSDLQNTIIYEESFDSNPI